MQSILVIFVIVNSLIRTSLNTIKNGNVNNAKTKCFSKANGYHFNPIPQCIKEATKLELALCSLNMVNTYLYTATPLSGQR